MRIKKIKANVDGWSDWIQPVRTGYRAQCCDCELVHVVDFRIKNKRVQFRARRGSKLKKRYASNIHDNHDLLQSQEKSK